MVRHPAGLAQGCPRQAAPLTPGAARLLLSDQGRAAVEVASAHDLTGPARVATATSLGTRFGTELGPLALDQALLRSRAVAKHPRGGELWWTGESLEQASAYDVAVHRTTRFSAPVLDLCCSVGGDLLPLALAHGWAVGVDLDEARLLLAAANARVLGADVSLVRADATTVPWPAGASVFVDPARRLGRRRVFDPRDYAPPLDAVLGWEVRELGVKVAPGIDYDALPACASGTLEVEVVSLRGDVKEAVLWGGGARRGAARTATLLPGGDSLVSAGAPTPRVAPPGPWLLEPDGAVIRAHLVEEVASLVDGWLLDATIAYVAAEAPTPTPFGRWFEVLEVMPFSLKRLRARLRELDAGNVVVKKRGTAVEPEQLRRQLALRGSQEVTVVLTRSAGAQVAMVVRPTR